MSRRRSLLLGFAMALPVLVAILVVQQRRYATRPPSYFAIPPFTLIDQDSTPFRDTDLKGHVWVVSFAYTHCPDVCPLITKRMGDLRDDLARSNDLGEIRLLTITVDPKRDSPAVLRAYAARFNARKPDWFFLTGQPDSVLALIGKGFRLSVMPAPEHPEHANPDESMIPHTDRIILLDGEARVRGTYPFSDPESLEELRKDLRRLY